MFKIEDPNMEKPPKKRGCIGCGWWIEIPLVLLAFLFFFAYTWSPPMRVKDKGKEAEVKANLHTIQLAVEQFAIDTGGTYPPYLIGGEGRHSVYIEKSANAFKDVKDCLDQRQLADPLLRKGYLQAYPRNPFVKGGGWAIHLFQEDVADPLRNGTEAAKLHGTRFGAECNLMGSVIADNRYPGTYADFGYSFYDLWEPNKPNPFLPGEFFYRSRSVLVSTHNEDDQQLITEVVQDYMLGGYGSIRTKGRDIFGPDPTGVNEASPFGVSKKGVMDYGNPNGIRDSIILVLVPGEDTKGFRD